MNPIVEPEFKVLIPPLTAEEWQQLEANLLAEGCRNPLVVWGSCGILLDGHNRLEICREHNIHYEITELFLPDRNAAKRWIINNQFGRRNLSADQMSYLRGKQYQSQRQDRTNNLAQNRITPPKGQNDPSGNTAECLARQHRVSQKTIQRDARYAKAIDTIAENCGDDVRDIILSHDTRITRKDVIGVAKASPKYQRTIIAKLITGDLKNVRAAKREVKRERTESQVEGCQGMILDGWYQGDWRDHISKLTDGSVSLLLTDPPYDEDYQSQQRKVLNDTIEKDAKQGQMFCELEDVLTALYPKLTADSHLLVFCTWKSEPDARASVESSGYTVRGVLIWVRDNHPSGNLVGGFTPKHERIIHAVKGNPVMIKPMGDVMVVVKDSSDCHATEKPVDLLRKLVEATTVEGALVADPFGCVASTCIAAYLSGRRYWGCEIDPGNYAVGLTCFCNEL